MMQLVYLYMTGNIKKDQQSIDQLMKTTELQLKNRLLQPEAVFSDSLNLTLTKHNPRSKSLEVADLAKMDYDRILAMAKERTANAAAFTFTIIGNYNDSTIRPLIEQYLGSLPVQKKIVKGKDQSTDYQGKVVNDFKHKAETPKAIAVLHWYSKKMPYTPENAVRANAVGQVLQMVYLKEIREQRIGGNSYVLLRLAGAQEANKAKEIFDNGTLLGVQGAYYYNTIFGPVGATLGYSNRTKSPYLYLNLGYEF